MEAAGAYLRQLRLKHKPELTQKDLAALLQTSLRNITRWERGVRVPNSKTLLDLLRVLGGTLEHYNSLLYDKAATEETGRAFAERFLTEVQRARLNPFLETYEDEELLEVIRRIRKDPIKLNRFLRYGQSLVAEMPDED